MKNKLANLLLFLIMLSLCWGVGNTALYFVDHVDLRQPVSMMYDMRTAGNLNVFPGIVPQNWIRKTVHPMFANTLPDDLPLPLGSTPYTIYPYCQEDEGWYFSRSDRFGFNNPDELHDTAVDTLIVGDSFAQGACTPYNTQFYLNKSGVSTISLGMGGNGPLTTSFALHEYLKEYKPKDIYWLIVLNDQDDLFYEINDNVLKRHLKEDEFTLNYFSDKFNDVLLDYKNNISEIIPEYLKANQGNIEFINSKANLISEFKRILYGHYLINRVSGLAKVVDKPSHPYEYSRPNKETQDIMNSIFKKSYLKAKNNGVELRFVFIPSKGTCLRLKGKEPFEFIKEYFNKENIKYLNFADLVNSSDRCTDYFAMKQGGHLNSEGYKYLSEYVLADISM